MDGICGAGAGKTVGRSAEAQAPCKRREQRADAWGLRLRIGENAVFSGTMPGPHREVADMHISEGVLSPTVLGLGAALATAGVAVGLRKVDYDRLMTVAMLAATFFVGSLVHVPVMMRISKIL